MPTPPAEQTRAWRMGLVLAPSAVLLGAAAAGWTGPWALGLGAALAAGCGLVAVYGFRSPQASSSPRAPASENTSTADLARRERDELRRVLEGVPSPVLALDRAGVVLVHNTSAREFFADRPGPLRGLALEELFTQAEVLGQHSAALAGTARTGQIRVTTREGVRTFQVLTAPAPRGPGAGATDGGVAVVLTLRDVTELATAVQLKTDFVANASHELRTPLSSIRAAVETMADGAWDDHAMRGRLAQLIAQNVERLEEMVRDLLDLSRLESPEAPVQSVPVDLREVFAHLRETFGVEASERSLSLAFEPSPGTTALRTDPRLLHLILKNLLENAIKFAYAGTTVRVLAERTGEIDDPSRRGALRLRVIDRGIGIPLANQQRIFERFYQVDPARSGGAPRRGTGLGLAIVKHAVKVLGGTITVDSIWKEGTTMTVELPGVIEPEPAPTGPGPLSAAPGPQAHPSG
mgnify:CR=1 FL=1|jgi:signal transduction histidine kinase